MRRFVLIACLVFLGCEAGRPLEPIPDGSPPIAAAESSGVWIDWACPTFTVRVGLEDDRHILPTIYIAPDFYLMWEYRTSGDTRYYVSGSLELEGNPGRVEVLVYMPGGELEHFGGAPVPCGGR